MPTFLFLVSKTALISYMSLMTVTLHIQEKTPAETYLVACSGVWVAPHEVLTAGHCIEKLNEKVWVKDSEGRSFTAKAMAVNTQLDLALVKVQAPSHEFVTIGKAVNSGQDIYLLSSEEDMPETYGEGVVSNIVMDKHVISIVHTASILHGASGSGLFNHYGQLVGINTAMLKNLAWAVDISEVEYFLKRARLSNTSD